MLSLNYDTVTLTAASVKYIDHIFTLMITKKIKLFFTFFFNFIKLPIINNFQPITS